MSAHLLTLRELSEREVVERVAAVLLEGGVAALPAEGLYGLHALADMPQAVERIRAIKASGARRGFIGLIAAPGDLSRWCTPDRTIRALTRRHWPGPLTLIVPAHASVPAALLAEDGTIALRCPGNAFLRSVVVAARGIVISSSANLPGGEPAVRVEEIPPEWVDVMVDAGTLSGIPSTVARVKNGRVEVLREGATRLGDVALDDAPEAT